MNWRRTVPSWLSLSFAGAIVVGVLLLVGWIKPYLNGPDLAIATIYRPKPVPVAVETVKWLKGDTVVIKGPVKVIHDLTPKEEARLDRDFGVKLPELRAENKELAKVLDVPKAPNGGEMLLTVNTGSGDIDGIFRPKAAPFMNIGGQREIGVGYDVIQRGVVIHYSQDLGRIAAVVVKATASATIPIAPGARPVMAAQIDAVVRF